MSLFSELKRRNVVRVTIAYTVAGWLLVQVGDIAAQNFEAPAWVMKMFMTALIAGFPFVVFFSWAYELTPEGIKRDRDIDRSQSITGETGRKLDYVIIALLAAAIIIVLTDRMVPEAAPPAQVATVETAAGPVPANAGIEKNSIAVLPFVNMSDDPSQEYFSDGIAEELLNLLVRVDGLDVASRTSSFAYKGANPNIPQIAADLKVANILEGSVRKAGNRVRITAQLIDVATDRHLWSDTYDRELTDIFAIQDEIATSIVAALQNELGLDVSGDGIEVTDIPDNLDAYDLFLRGHAILISRGNLAEAVRLFERAVELDPEYARAWADLGAAAWVAPGWNYFDRDYRAISESAIERALELDENQSMAWAVKHNIDQDDEDGQDYNQAFESLDKAIEIDPKNTTAWLWRGLLWSELGFHARATEDLEQCLKIDPAYQNCQFHLANAHALMGDRERAIEIQKKLWRTGFRGVIAANVLLLLNSGETLAAYVLAARLSTNPDFPVKEWLDALEYPERDHSSSVAKAEAYLAMEEPVGVREALMLAFGAYGRLKIDPHYPQSWIWSPEYPQWRKSPEFKQHVEDLNLEAYWREHGFPPQCRPVGGEDFECE
jgi:TolB-like protein/Flp pilus assembly protein TadD